MIIIQLPHSYTVNSDDIVRLEIFMTLHPEDRDSVDLWNVLSHITQHHNTEDLNLNDVLQLV